MSQPRLQGYLKLLSPEHKHTSRAMVRILFFAILTALIFTGEGQEDQCEQSEHVEDISKLESCNGVGTFISVIYRPPSGASNCSSIDDDYHILIYHHDFDRSITIEKHPPPERHNETACLVHLTLGPDIFVIENNDTLLQVWMKLITMPAVTYCSNNFTLLVDTDPPDPVNPQIHVGCNSVDVEWLAPFSPPGCPVRQYDIELNDEYFNITNTSLLHHSWPDLSPNMLNTLSISAVNDIGPSIQSNNTFKTALNPQVMFADYHVLLNHSNALLTIKAEVNNSCIYSVPTHFYYNASCDPNTTVNETRNVSNFYQLPVPIDCLNCTACLIWSNLNSSLTLCNITFNTTQLLFIKLQPINNGLNFTCHYRPNSSLWGCGILVNNSFNDTTSVLPVNEAVGTITNLCPGEYNVAMFYVKDGMDHVIEYVTVNISGTSCSNGTPTPSGNDDDNNKNNLLKILLPSLAGPALLIAVVAFVIIIYRCKKRRGSYKPKEQTENNSSDTEMQERNGNHGYARTAKSLNEKSRSELSSSATPTIKPSHSVKDEEASTTQEKDDASARNTVNDIKKNDSISEARGTGTATGYMGGSNYVGSSQKVPREGVDGDDIDEEIVYEADVHEATDKQQANIHECVPSKPDKKSMKRSKSSESIKSTSSASRVLRRLSSKTNTGTDQERETLLPPITDNSDVVQQDPEVPASNNDMAGEFV